MFKKGGRKAPLCIPCPYDPDLHENDIPDNRNPWIATLTIFGYPEVNRGMAALFT
jgi:hypothetical protein